MRRRYLIGLLVVVVLAVLCLIPSPLNAAKAADGGTRMYSPVLPIYKVVDWNKIEIAQHDPDGPDANTSNGKTTKGIQVFIFGMSIYDGRYTIEGIHTR
ncbi:hypothetical protein SAMN02910456_00100 [Ruminococcaceae bacterium YRB3002]|nr:hypothetical protein SAMN02910456_00100 [Ruminococcaceae bacterium YRB3002]